MHQMLVRDIKPVCYRQVSCKRHSTCTKKKAPGFCQRKTLQQPYLAHGQTPPTDALAALIGIPPLILNTCPVFKMHLINEIGIRKTYADSRYRDRGPLTMYLSRSSLFTILLYRSSILWMAECRDSAPCSPIRPAPTCHRLSHGITWSSIMCILGKTVARGNSCR